MDDKLAPLIIWESPEEQHGAPSIVYFGSLEEIKNRNRDPRADGERVGTLALVPWVKHSFVDGLIRSAGDNIYYFRLG